MLCTLLKVIDNHWFGPPNLYVENINMPLVPLQKKGILNQFSKSISKADSIIIGFDPIPTIVIACTKISKIL